VQVDRLGWIDAYVTLALAGGAAKSSIKKREQHPVWDERFALPADDIAAPLLVTLLDWEMTHADRAVGQLLVQVQDPPPPRTKWTRRVPHPVLIGHAASLTPY
jgi:Ca2+-dependent lipid-binding protein